MATCIFIKLIYGFTNEDKLSLLDGLCRKAVRSLQLIYKFQVSILSTLPEEIMKMISVDIWKSRSTYITNFDVFHRSMYGVDHDGETYLGFSYGIISNIFEESPEVFAGKFCLSQVEPPSQIVELYGKHFPHISMKSYALLQGAYTSHYASGNIMLLFFSKRGL